LRGVENAGVKNAARSKLRAGKCGNGNLGTVMQGVENAGAAF